MHYSICLWGLNTDLDNYIAKGIKNIRCVVFTDSNMFFRKGMLDVFSGIDIIVFPQEVYHMEKHIVDNKIHPSKIYLPRNLYKPDDLFGIDFNLAAVKVYVKENSLTHKELLKSNKQFNITVY